MAHPANAACQTLKTNNTNAATTAIVAVKAALAQVTAPCAGEAIAYTLQLSGFNPVFARSSDPTLSLASDSTLTTAKGQITSSGLVAALATLKAAIAAAYTAAGAAQQAQWDEALAAFYATYGFTAFLNLPINHDDATRRAIFG